MQGTAIALSNGTKTQLDILLGGRLLGSLRLNLHGQNERKLDLRHTILSDQRARKSCMPWFGQLGALASGLNW